MSPPAPLPLVELLTWWPSAMPPDDETTVMLHHTPGEATEPTWPGFLLTDTDRWHSADGHPMPDPTYWAEMPNGPCQPGMDTPATNLREVARELVRHAATVGLVLTIEQRPLQPLAQGHYETVVSVREVRR